MPSFIFVRHGQSKANAEGVIADQHSPLTNEGIKQARKTALELADFGITVIASSPYFRTQQTAQIIASELGLNPAHIKIIDELRERELGVLQNQPREHEGTWYFSNDITEGIEPRDELLSRMDNCLKQLTDLSTNQVLLVVGHAISGFFMLQAASGNTTVSQLEPPSQMSNADFIEVKY